MVMSFRIVLVVSEEEDESMLVPICSGESGGEFVGVVCTEPDFDTI